MENNAKAIWMGLVSVVSLAVVVVIFTAKPPATNTVTTLPQPNQLNSVIENTTTQGADVTGSGLYLMATRITELGSLPGSLEGTEVDGQLMIDPNGVLIINKGIQDTFEYFLSLMGEEDLEAISIRIAAHLANSLPPQAADQAWGIFEHYMDYKIALGNFSDHVETLDQTIVMLSEVHTLRREYLGPDVADAFFAEEEAYDQFTVARMQMNSNSDVSPEQKERQLDQMLENLPEDAREVYLDNEKRKDLENTVVQLKEAGASAEEVWQVREQAFGQEAANRLLALDAKRSEWDQRYQQYTVEKNNILNSSLYVSDKTEQIDRLRERVFTHNEIKRVSVLDRVEVEPAE